MPKSLFSQSVSISMINVAEDGKQNGAVAERSRRIADFWKQEIFVPDHLPPLLAEQLGLKELYFRYVVKPGNPDLYLGHSADEQKSDKEPFDTALATANVGMLTSFAGINPEGRIIVAGYDMKNAGELLRLKVSLTHPESQEIMAIAEQEGVGIFDTLISTDNTGYPDHTAPVVGGMTAQKDMSGLVRLVNLPEGAHLGPQTPFGFSRKTTDDIGEKLGFHSWRTDGTVSLVYKDVLNVEVPRFLHS